MVECKVNRHKDKGVKDYWGQTRGLCQYVEKGLSMSDERWSISDGERDLFSCQACIGLDSQVKVDLLDTCWCVLNPGIEAQISPGCLSRGSCNLTICIHV